MYLISDIFAVITRRTWNALLASPFYNWTDVSKMVDCTVDLLHVIYVIHSVECSAFFLGNQLYESGVIIQHFRNTLLPYQG
jgi:hypothetical protein